MTANAMITIYGRANSWNVRKVLWLAEDLRLPFERIDMGRGFQPTQTPEFMALNPNAMIPAVVDGGAVIWESNAILRYLAAKYGPGASQERLYPASLEKRAVVDQWLDWQLGHLSIPVRNLFQGLFLKNEAFSSPAQMSAARQESAMLMGILAGQLANSGGFVAGPDFTIADYALGVTVHRWYSLDIERPSLPEAEAYYARIAARPGFRKTDTGAP